MPAAGTGTIRTAYDKGISGKIVMLIAGDGCPVLADTIQYCLKIALPGPILRRKVININKGKRRFRKKVIHQRDPFRQLCQLVVCGQLNSAAQGGRCECMFRLPFHLFDSL